MHHQSNDSDLTVQTKQQQNSSIVTDLLLPSSLIDRLCEEVGHEYRERIYTLSIIVRMFIMQVLSKDQSCQQVVARLNG